MTYNELCRTLRNAGIDEYRTEASVLLEHFYGVSGAVLPFSNEDYDSPLLRKAVSERISHRPLQYIVGEWQFCTETYCVGEGCLIPRPETELLVLTADRLLPENATFLDLGTGSGCISVSLLVRRPDLSAVAADLSETALSYAEENAERNGVSARIRFVHTDILKPDAPAKLCGDGKVAAVLSNPPYIRSSELEKLAPELSYEPKTALDGGNDGLVFYRKIVEGFADRLQDGGFMLFETGFDQAGDLSGIAEMHGFDCAIEKDLSGRDRTALLTPRPVRCKTPENTLAETEK